MNSAHKAVPPTGDNPPFIVRVQGAVLQAEPSAPCPLCTPWEDPSCTCHSLKHYTTLFNEAMIPALYREATLETTDADSLASLSLRRTTTWVQTWTRREPLPDSALLLSGPNGVGKSFLMAGLARSLTLDRGIGTLFVDFGHLLLRLKATFNGQGSEYAILDSLQRPQVLILDDVGSHRDSAWSRDVLQSIIASRYNACARTFLTTNLPISGHGAAGPSPFEKWVGPHCASRLAEMCIWIPVDGPDRRRLARRRPGSASSSEVCTE